MTALSRFFLTAKHWQLFILLFGTMTVAQIAMIAASVSTETNTSSVMIGTLMLPFIAALLYWFWVLGSFLHSITQPQIRPRMVFFRVALLCPAIYLPVFVFLFPNFPPGLSLLFLVHMFATFCMFYLLYFVAKSLVVAETGKPAGFYDFAGPLFLIWFFPLGVWFVQPRINRLFAERQIIQADEQLRTE